MVVDELLTVELFWNESLVKSVDFAISELFSILMLGKVDLDTSIEFCTSTLGTDPDKVSSGWLESDSDSDSDEDSSWVCNIGLRVWSG